MGQKPLSEMTIKEFLHQQLELLAKESQRTLPEELPKLTFAMCEVVKLFVAL